MHRLRPGHRRRGRAPLTARRAAAYWLLVRTRVGGPIRAHASTRRPSIEPGDLALCYAAGWKALFAVVEVGGPFEHDPSRDRWGWRMPLRPLHVLHDLATAPPVEAAGVSPRSLGRHSYVRLTREQFEAGEAALAAATPASPGPPCPEV